MENIAHTHAEATVVHQPEPIPGHPAETGPLLLADGLPGVVEVRTMDGRTLYRYAAIPTPTGPQDQGPAQAGNAVPAWAKTTALLLASASSAALMAALALKVFAEAAAAFAAALLLLAQVGLVLAVVVALVAAVIKGRTRGTQRATATATATAGLFGRAKATATATITNR